MILTLIRHSKTVLEKEVPNLLWKLSDEGISLAIELAQSEVINGVEIMYSSLQTKALQTTLLLAKDNHIPIKTHSDLTELTSITNKFIEDFETTVQSLYRGEVERVNDGESISEGQIRFNAAIEEIIETEQGKDNIGIVAHGNILSIFAAQYTDKSAYEIHKTLKMPDVAIFDWDTKKFIKFFGDKYD